MREGAKGRRAKVPSTRFSLILESWITGKPSVMAPIKVAIDDDDAEARAREDSILSETLFTLRKLCLHPACTAPFPPVPPSAPPSPREFYRIYRGGTGIVIVHSNKNSVRRVFNEFVTKKRRTPSCHSSRSSLVPAGGEGEGKRGRARRAHRTSSFRFH